MAANSKIPWPATYLGRLQAFTEELGQIGQPACAATLTERFKGVTQEQVEATLSALVLFGRVEQKGQLFSLPS